MATEEKGIYFSVKGVSYKFIGGDYDKGEAVAAKIGDTYYASFKSAFDAAKAGDEIVLLADVTESVTLPAGVVFNGNGKTVSGTIKVIVGMLPTIVWTFEDIRDEEGNLIGIDETKDIVKNGDGAAVQTGQRIGKIQIQQRVRCLGGYVPGRDIYAQTGGKWGRFEDRGYCLSQGRCFHNYP